MTPAVVPTVRFELGVLASTWTGANEDDAPVGRPASESATVPGNPPVLETPIV